jgi:hypothetical protein
MLALKAPALNVPQILTLRSAPGTLSVPTIRSVVAPGKKDVGPGTTAHCPLVKPDPLVIGEVSVRTN